MEFLSRAAKEVLTCPIPSSFGSFKRFPGSVFQKLRQKAEPKMVLAPLANVTGMNKDIR